MPAVHVDAHDLYAHALAELVDLLRVFTAQRVRLFEKPIIVVRHARHVHQSLDVVLRQLHEQAERRDARDVAVEFIADLVGHEAHLLPLHQLSFRLIGSPLHLRAVPRDVR